MKSHPAKYGIDPSLSGRIVFLQSGRETSTNAFDINEGITIRCLIPRTLGPENIYIQIFDEALSCIAYEVSAEWNGLAGGVDIYDALIEPGRISRGLYFFRLRLELPLGVAYGHKLGEVTYFMEQDERRDLYQLTACDFLRDEPCEQYGGIIYHIFVDRFNRGGKFTPRDGSIYVEDWSHGIPEYPEYPGAPLKNNRFYGGTLWGIIDKLDYIRSLGVSVIYLSPIFDAASNHKYDTGDYMTVDPAFGGEEALVKLISEAKDRGIRIILDGVFNHTGSDSIYFNREGNYDSVGAYQSTESKYYPWYDFKEYPNKYTCWWDIDILPRINPDNPVCGDYFTSKNGVVDKYSRMGVLGFRLDVVDELSDPFVKRIKKRLCTNDPSSILYGEVWEDGSNKIAYGVRKSYFQGGELDGVMNYPIRKGIISFLTRSDPSDLRYALTDIINNAPRRVQNMQMNLLGTHDTERIVTLLGGESSAGRSNSYLCTKRMNDIERGTAKRRLRMAYAILATIPGIPVIFYGDETALEGYHDPFNRMPYPWDKQDPRLIDYYKNIGRIRRGISTYRDGEFKLIALRGDLLVFLRTDGERSLVTYVNNSKYTQTIDFDREVISLIKEGTAQKFDIPAFTAEIFECRAGTNISFD